MQGVTTYEDNANNPGTELKVEAYLPLVMKIALHIKRRLPSHIELDDLVQSGIVGLIEAHKRFDPEKETKFDTFAGVRIHGAIIDHLRKNSWGTRDAAKFMRTINKAISKLEQLGEPHPTPSAIADELGVTPDEYQAMLVKINVSHVVSMECYNVESDDSFASAEDDPASIHEQDETKERLKALITRLPERDQQLLALYYLEEFSFKEIGEVLGLTEARICQLHGQALARLRSEMVAEDKIVAPRRRVAADTTEVDSNEDDIITAEEEILLE